VLLGERSLVRLDVALQPRQVAVEIEEVVEPRCLVRRASELFFLDGDELAGVESDEGALCAVKRQQQYATTT